MGKTVVKVFPSMIHNMSYRGKSIPAIVSQCVTQGHLYLHICHLAHVTCQSSLWISAGDGGT